MKILEKHLTSRLADYYKGSGYQILQEVRLYPREIDLLLFDPIAVDLIAVEVKLSDWRKAINQAMLNKLYSHFSLIAITSNAVNHLPLNLLEERGLGLIEIDARGRNNKNFRAILKAERSRETNRLLLREIYNRFVNEYGVDNYVCREGA